MIWCPRRRRFADFIVSIPPYDETCPVTIHLEQRLNFQPLRMKSDTKWLLKVFRNGPTTLQLIAERMPMPQYLDLYNSYYAKLAILDEQNRIIFTNILVDFDHSCWEFRLEIEERNIFIEQKLFLHYTLGVAYWTPPLDISRTRQLWFEQGYPSDVTIRTREKDLHCHKSILTRNCDYFRFLLRIGMLNSGIIDWTMVPCDAIVIEDFLHYLYTGGQAPPKIEETCFVLIDLADYCNQFDLRLLCEFTMSHVININNASKIFVIADKYDSMELKETVIHFALENSNWNALKDEMEPEYARRFCVFGSWLGCSGTLLHDDA